MYADEGNMAGQLSPRRSGKGEEMTMDVKKLGCRVNYTMDENEKIVIKGRKYGVTQLTVLSLIVMFLGLTLAIMGLMRSMQYHDWKGMIDIVIAALIILTGLSYKTAASDARIKTVADRVVPEAEDKQEK